MDDSRTAGRAPVLATAKDDIARLLTNPPSTFLATLTALMRAEARASEAHDRLVEWIAAWCSPEECRAIAEAAAVAGRAGPPPPAFLDHMGDAEAHAALASEDEAAAYAWAFAKRLPPDRRGRLVRAIGTLGGKDAA